MKRWIFFIFLLVLALPGMAQTGYSKKSKKKKTRSERTNRPLESDNFLDKVWVGGNLSDLSFFNNSFRFGLTPVGAIQLNKTVSAGVMVRMAYRYERLYDFYGNSYKFESFDVGPGIFARFDIMDKYFAHIEFEHAFIEQPVAGPGGIIVENGKVVTVSTTENYVYIGIGFLSGGEKAKFLTSLHYNVLDDINYSRIPWDFRIGMLWNLGTPSASKEK
ncbi:MAG: hypothetical protein DRI69_00615 [Bacteroidetes bacterium]|nr:MAG: hypothetical protein DRI69_00615 [Bacteroidota bacterium]